MRWWPLLAIVGCGDPLAGGDFAGDAKLKVQAIVWGEHEVQAVNPTFGIAWKWYQDGQPAVLITEARALPSKLPAILDIEVFDAPPTEAPTIVDSDHGPLEVDLGCPIMFDDVDSDGLLGIDDRLLAISPNELLVFVRDQEGSLASDGSYRFVDFAAVDPSYRLVQGVCTEEGVPSGELRQTALDHPLAVRVLETSTAEQTCVRFF